MKNLGSIGNQSFKLISIAITSCVLAHTAMGQASQQEVPGGDTTAKELIRQWVATERLLGEEKNSWREEKAQMNELLKLHVLEIKLLNQELANTGRSVAEVDKSKADLEAKVSDGIKTRTKLRQFLLKLKPRVIALEKRFPNALKLQVEKSIATLTSVNDDTSVRDILEATVNILEQASVFNGSVYQRSESVMMGSETWSAEVIYLGLGRAYFFVGRKAGVGKPTADGWKWTRDDSILDEVKKAVQVFKKQKQPQLVELPIQVKP